MNGTVAPVLIMKRVWKWSKPGQTSDKPRKRTHFSSSNKLNHSRDPDPFLFLLSLSWFQFLYWITRSHTHTHSLYYDLSTKLFILSCWNLLKQFYINPFYSWVFFTRKICLYTARYVFFLVLTMIFGHMGFWVLFKFVFLDLFFVIFELLVKFCLVGMFEFLF